MKYKFRIIKPKMTDWIEQEGTSFADAIQQYHFDNVGMFDITYAPEGKEEQCFALFESASTGEKLLSRICRSRIRRKGGVESKASKQRKDISYVASQLEVPVEDLTGEWEGEESY